MYCRGCGYNLYGLTSCRCPECGRNFEPANSRTFLPRPRRRWLRRLLWISAPPVVVLILAAAVGTWLYDGWDRERQTAGAMHTVYVRDVQPLGGDSLRKHLGPLGRYLDRYRSAKGPVDVETPPEDIAALAHFHYLGVLELRTVGFTDANVSAIADLADVTELHLGGNMTDTGLAQLSGLRHLEILDITGTFTGSALVRLDLRCLRELRLESRSLTDAAVRPLTECPQLERLTLQWGTFTDAGLVHLKALHRLQYLKLQGDSFTGSALTQLDLHDLRELALAGAHEHGALLDDSLFTALPVGKRLVSLRVSYGVVTAGGVQRLASVSSLRSVALQGMHMNDQTLTALAECPQIEDLSLRLCPITDAGLHRLTTMKGLRHLDLRGTPTTVTGRAELQAALPTLHIDD